MTRVDACAGNVLTLLCDGTEYFPALEAAIARARRFIHLETYIYADDATGRRIASALEAAVARGVAVYLLVDGFGSRRYFGALHDRLLAAGVTVCMYRPDRAPWDLRRAHLQRLHRKIAVIDGETGFVGGINIIDDMNTPGHVPPRRDYAVRVEGPLLAAMIAEAVNLLGRLGVRVDRDVRHADRAPRPPVRGTQSAALVVRDNLRHRADIEEAYLAQIESAREEIILASAYFFPGVRFRHALIDAAARGVRVVLLLQGRVEYALLHYASRALYGVLLEGGVRIVEYTASFLHAKVAVIDGRWATVGSSNIDPFSLLVAREANIVVHDAAFAQALRMSLVALMEEGGQQVPADHRAQVPLGTRVRIWVAYGIARFLIGWFGYGGARH